MPGTLAPPALDLPLCLCGIPLRPENHEDLYSILQFLGFAKIRASKEPPFFPDPNEPHWTFNGIPLIARNCDRVIKELLMIKEALDNGVTVYSHPNAVAWRESHAQRKEQNNNA